MALPDVMAPPCLCRAGVETAMALPDDLPTGAAETAVDLPDVMVPLCLCTGGGGDSRGFARRDGSPLSLPRGGGDSRGFARRFAHGGGGDSRGFARRDGSPTGVAETAVALPDVMVPGDSRGFARRDVFPSVFSTGVAETAVALPDGGGDSRCFAR